MPVEAELAVWTPVDIATPRLMLSQRKIRGTDHQRAYQFLFRLNLSFFSADSAESRAGMPGMLRGGVFCLWVLWFAGWECVWRPDRQHARCCGRIRGKNTTAD